MQAPLEEASGAELSRAERRYLHELVARLDRLVSGLIGVYLFGSGAYGDHDPAGSDLDIQAVLAGVPPPSTLAGIVAAVRHAALPCPARRLELVVYPQDVVARPVPPLAFALNLNTGAGMSDRVTTEPAAEAPHWFVIDVAAGRETGIRLLGPPVSEVFGPLAPPLVLEALAESLTWHLRQEATTPNTVLNACRAWHHARTGAWVSKRDAACWLLAERPDLIIAADALAVRSTGEPLPVDRVEEVVNEALRAVRGG